MNNDAKILNNTLVTWIQQCIKELYIMTKGDFTQMYKVGLTLENQST